MFQNERTRASGAHHTGRVFIRRVQGRLGAVRPLPCQSDVAHWSRAETSHVGHVVVCGFRVTGSPQWRIWFCIRRRLAKDGQALAGIKINPRGRCTANRKGEDISSVEDLWSSEQNVQDVLLNAESR